jgi:hypothetical protein
MKHSPDVPYSLQSRLSTEVRIRGLKRHQANVSAWAATDHGQLPTLEQANAEEFAATELLLTALGDLALHTPDEVFPYVGYGDRPNPEWFGL